MESMLIQSDTASNEDIEKKQQQHAVQVQKQALKEALEDESPPEPVTDWLVWFCFQQQGPRTRQQPAMESVGISSIYLSIRLSWMVWMISGNRNEK